MYVHTQVAAATTVEWWAHCRPHTSGHQLHFDSDDEGCGGARHPLLSVVLFLGGGGLVGGPTLVTDQLLGGPLASRGWLVGPSDNRLVAFDARVLHGVIPGRGVSPEAARASAQAAAAAARSRSAPGGSCGGNGGAGNGQSVTTSGDGRRVTLMVAFWDRIQVRHAPADAPTDTPGAARPWPNQETTAYTWPRLLEPLAEEQWRQSDAEAASMRLVPPTPVAQVWQPLQPSSSSTQPAEAAAATTVASYSRCFQGI